MIDRRATVIGMPARDDGPAAPCGKCGRPGPQPGAGTGRLSTLSTHVMEAFEVVERLEHVAGSLRQALHTEFTAGVERHIAAVRAEAAELIVSAHAERDLARQEADVARRALAQARRDATRADDAAHAARQNAAQAVQAAQADVVRLREERDTAVAAAETRVAATLAELRARLVGLEAERDARTVERDAARTELHKAQAQLARLGQRANNLADELGRLCAQTQELEVVETPAGADATVTAAEAATPSPA
jgi:chromosome segregation ATPase